MISATANQSTQFCHFCGSFMQNGKTGETTCQFDYNVTGSVSDLILTQQRIVNKS